MDQIFAFLILTIKLLRANEIFYCDFDQLGVESSKLCGGLNIYRYESSGTVLIGESERLNLINSKPVFITDVKSITRGTKQSNQTCNIPFILNEMENNFCAQNSSSFFCEVDKLGDGQLDECNLGLFIRTKSQSINGEPYFIKIDFNKSILVPKPGKYLISFYTYFDCKEQNCEAVDDSLSVIIKGTDEYLEVYKNGTSYGRLNDTTWKKDEIIFNIRSTNITLELVFSRNIGNVTVGPAGIYFDEIKITEAPEEPVSSDIPVATSTEHLHFSEFSTASPIIDTTNFNSSTMETSSLMQGTSTSKVSSTPDIKITSSYMSIEPFTYEGLTSTLTNLVTNTTDIPFTHLPTSRLPIETTNNLLTNIIESTGISTTVPMVTHVSILSTSEFSKEPSTSSSMFLTVSSEETRTSIYSTSMPIETTYKHRSTTQELTSLIETTKSMETTINFDTSTYKTSSPSSTHDPSSFSIPNTKTTTVLTTFDITISPVFESSSTDTKPIKTSTIKITSSSLQTSTLLEPGSSTSSFANTVVMTDYYSSEPSSSDYTSSYLPSTTKNGLSSSLLAITISVSIGGVILIVLAAFFVTHYILVKNERRKIEAPENNENFDEHVL